MAGVSDKESIFENEIPRSLSDDPVIIPVSPHPVSTAGQELDTQRGAGEIAEDEAPKDLEGQVVGDSPASTTVRGDTPSDVIRAAKDSQLNTMRHRLARWLLALVGIVAVALIVAVSLVGPAAQSALRDMATLIFPPLVTLAGTSFAWFYSGRGGSGKPGR